ncbi:hypothetical protein KKB68_02015, partial [Patescibacteria group bacterium]|nr:hypothetical protein [Patescibacteria group bacterium]
MEKIRTFRFAQEPCFPRFARKISWIQVGSKRDGGNIYGSEVREALSEDFNLELKKVKAKY